MSSPRRGTPAQLVFPGRAARGGQRSSEATDQSAAGASAARGRNLGNFAPRHAKLVGGVRWRKARACSKESGRVRTFVRRERGGCHTCWEALESQRRTQEVLLAAEPEHGSEWNLSRGHERRTCGEGADTEDSKYLLLVADNDKIHALFPFQIFMKDKSCGHVTREGGVEPWRRFR